MICYFAFPSSEIGVLFEDDGDTSCLKEVLGSVKCIPIRQDANQSQRGKERRSDSHQMTVCHKDTKNIARIKMENQGLRSEDKK